MSLTYGFYNSVNHDRKYNAEQLSTLFNGIINDGVFSNIGSALTVSAGSGMTVNVEEGRAWFNGTWTNNDSILPLTIPQSESILNRIDIVALEVNSGVDVRANSIKVIKGTPASSPVPPSLISNDLTHQYPLAHVYVTAGATSITQSNITNKVGTSVCPFITGVLETISIDGLVAQWNSEFDIWLNSIKGKLGDDIAGNLQYQIDALDENLQNQIDAISTIVGNGDIDCGGFTDDLTDVMLHDIDETAHPTIFIDAINETNTDDSKSLEEHIVSENSHGNIIIDGNVN